MNADGSDQKRITDANQEQNHPRWISGDLIAFWYYDFSGGTEGIGLVRPEGSAIGVMAGPYVNFDFYLQRP